MMSRLAFSMVAVSVGLAGCASTPSDHAGANRKPIRAAAPTPRATRPPATPSLPPTTPPEAPATSTLVEDSGFAARTRATLDRAGLTGPLADCILFVLTADHRDGRSQNPERVEEVVQFCESRTASAPPLPLGPADPSAVGCDDFEWQEEAQDTLDSNDGDPYFLDGDSNGEACEDLPRYEDEYGVPWGEDPPTDEDPIDVDDESDYVDE